MVFGLVEADQELFDEVAASRRDRREHTAPVLGVRTADHVTILFEALHGVRDARGVHLQSLPQLAHRQLPTPAEGEQLTGQRSRTLGGLEDLLGGDVLAIDDELGKGAFELFDELAGIHEVLARHLEELR